MTNQELTISLSPFCQNVWSLFSNKVKVCCELWFCHYLRNSIIHGPACQGYCFLYSLSVVATQHLCLLPRVKPSWTSSCTKRSKPPFHRNLPPSSKVFGFYHQVLRNGSGNLMVSHLSLPPLSWILLMRFNYASFPLNAKNSYITQNWTEMFCLF